MAWGSEGLGLVKWLMSGAAAAAGSIVVQALTTVGVAAVVNEFALPPMMETLQAQLAGAPLLFVQFITFTGADKAMSIILSAYLVLAGTGRITGMKKK